MSFVCKLFPLLLLATAVAAQTQPTVPTVSQSLPARTLVAGGTALSINLRDYFTIAGVTGPIAQFDTIKGKFNAELFTTDTPKTVTNFVTYVNRGAYTQSLIHRSVSGFVIQGGGFTLSGTTITPVPTDPPVQNEPKFSNTRGTIAMAKTSLGPDTATSQWFVNLGDNSANLDVSNGGFTVFGRVLGTGMTVVDAIAAVPVYDYSTQLGADFKQLPLLNNVLTTDNLVLVNSIRVIPTFPEVASATSALRFTGSLGSAGVVSGDIIASTLTIKPLATGNTTLTIRAVDTNDNAAETSFPVTVVSAPLFTTQPASQTVTAGGNTTLSAVATGSATFQWQRNGRVVPGVASATVNITNMQPTIAGLYTVVATSGGAALTSSPAILGVSTTSKVIGFGQELQPTDIVHPNGNVFDQVLVTGSSEAITADYTLNQITRTSFIDLDDDIVQVEFGGPGTLSILLDEATGPATPVKYNQPTVNYVKGHANIVITGADERTNLSVFTVGRATAYDPTGAYNILLTPSSTNNPANNGSPLFQGHSDTTYDGVANIARISIASTNGKFGGIRAANARLYDVTGMTGIYAPGVAFQGPIFVGDIIAYSAATPVFMIGSVAGETRITGGALRQDNGQPVQVSGLTQLKFTAGSDSQGNTLAVQNNQAILLQDGVNVTDQIVTH